MGYSIKYTKKQLAGKELKIPTSTYNEIHEAGYTIGTSDSGRYPDVRMKGKYVTSLKKALNVKSFKDGNHFNYSVRNVVMM